MQITLTPLLVGGTRIGVNRIMEYIYYLAAAAVAFWLGWQVNSWIMIRHMRSIMQDLGITQTQFDRLKQLATDPTPPVMQEMQARVEIMQGKIFCWLKNPEQFLGQADTPEDLMQLLSARYQGCRIIIAEEDGAAIMGSGSRVYDAETKEFTRNDHDT